MPRLLLTRGPQGSGKSTLLRGLGLGPYTLCPDDLRRVVAGPVLGRDGRLETDQGHDRRVWALFYELLEARMARGELLAIDATHRKPSDLKRYLQLAHRFRYEVAVADTSGVELARCLAWNQKRPEHQVVPEAVLRRTWQSCREHALPADLTSFAVHHEAGRLGLEQWLSDPAPLDLSSYRKVHHIGDLQGCWDPLVRYWGESGPSDEEAWIFVGDYCDRGPENGRVVTELLTLLGRPNIHLLWGNHEDELQRWVVGEGELGAEFAERTAPELTAAGVERAQVDALLAACRDVLIYRWGPHRVLVNHAGLSGLPAWLRAIPARQHRHGSGFYASPVDEQWSQNAPPGWFQVHGHRNVHELPIQAGQRSFNLEGQVENGGHLRVLTLDEHGWTGHLVRSRAVRPLDQRIAFGIERDPRIWPAWARQPMGLPVLEKSDFEALSQHPLVAVKTSASAPRVGAFNFTRDAFFKRSWDALNVRARGLFVDLDSREVVARSYDKFFNLEERPETQLGALRENLVFPVTAWVKENGYLGILGYRSDREELFFASKSTPDSDFARWFRALFLDTVGPAGAERTLRYLRDAQASMVFEVIDPVRDPHIIDYDEPKVILLDVVRRASAFQCLNPEGLNRLGKRLGLEVKQRGMVFSDWDGFSGWLRKARQPGWRYRGRHLEGFVLSDAAGFQTKIKLDYYNFWKRMRGLKDRLASVRRSGRPLGRDVSDPRVAAFFAWLQELPDERLQDSISSLRAAWESGERPPPRAPVATGPSKAEIGFTRALDGLMGQTIKPATADALVARALSDDRLVAALAAHPVRTALLLAASPGEDRSACAERVGLDLDGPGELR